MTYSEEKIQKYLHILESYKDIYHDTSSINEDYFKKSFKKVSCHNFNNAHFINHNGYRYCNKCFHSIGHILGYNEMIDVIFIKSIYKRHYHYQNKIEDINTKFDLKMTSNEKYELLKKLRKIVNVVIKKINEKWKRKRLINITYLIKKLLSEYDTSKANKIELNFSEKILKFYNNWYDDLKEHLKNESLILYKFCIKFLNCTFMKKLIQNSCQKSNN